MAKDTQYSIKNLQKQFPTDEVCLDYLFDHLHSRDCSCGGKYHKLNGRRQYQCSKCRFQIAPTANTIFEKSTTPLTLWYHALFVFSTAKSGISAKQMQRTLGTTYKTAWRILHLIRQSLKQGNGKLKGDVEMDEAYFGGKHYAGKNNEDIGRSMAKKSVVIGAVERGGRIRAKVVPDTKARTIGEFLTTNVENEEATLMTDKSNRYNKIAQGFERLTVNHSQQEYVRGNVHVNHIESFWAHVKRSIRGSHKVVSKRHLQEYLDGFVFHYNNRHSDKERFDALLGRIVYALVK